MLQAIQQEIASILAPTIQRWFGDSCANCLVRRRFGAIAKKYQSVSDSVSLSKVRSSCCSPSLVPWVDLPMFYRPLPVSVVLVMLTLLMLGALMMLTSGLLMLVGQLVLLAFVLLMPLHLAPGVSLVYRPVQHQPCPNINNFTIIIHQSMCLVEIRSQLGTLITCSLQKSCVWKHMTPTAFLRSP